jgi:Spy/CpxP family protein refolding chaperone
MRKWIIAFAAVGLLCLITGITGADGRRQSRWWNTPQYTEALKLTDSDIQQLNQVYEVSSLEMIELRGQVEAARLKLQFLLEKQELDEPALEAQYNHLEQARAALGKERFAFFVQVRKIIGPQRFSQLMEIFKERRRNRESAPSEKEGATD